MIARLHVLLPVWLTVRQGEEFTVYQYEDNGYKVRVFPPARSDQPDPPDRIHEVSLDGTPALRVDALRIDFQKENFDRAREPRFDPPQEIVARAINSFLIRLRYVARAAGIRSIDYPSVTWNVRYLNDDESELEDAEGLVRTRGGLSFSFSFVALSKAVWHDINQLPINFEPPPWEELLLDAQADLPRIGPAIVLAATALEVFIAHILDRLAEKGAVPANLWEWINNRGDYLREPRVEEQFDVLLRFFTGRSLKTDSAFWESFRNLRNARNSFVHEGRAEIGGSPVTPDIARKLVADASAIVAAVREWLPPDLHWPVFKHEVKIEAKWKLN